jgi:hypothetical protein
MESRNAQFSEEKCHELSRFCFEPQPAAAIAPKPWDQTKSELSFEFCPPQGRQDSLLRGVDITRPQRLAFVTVFGDV